jgi:cystathionine beta-lyase/cystathionine gamma-synthase
VGQEPEAAYSSVINPIYQSSTFAWSSLDDIPAIDYTRVANPNRLALEQVIASLEGAQHGVCYSSGMAAVTAVFNLLQSGDHLVMASDIYGGTHRQATVVLPRHGISMNEFDSGCAESLHEAVKPNSKMVIFESPTNPNLRIADIARVVAAAKQHGLVTVFDNTFASPALQNPLALGVDIVLHSTTKYIGGHSDVVGGAVATNDEELGHALFEYNKNMGANPSPFDCWLSLRGLKTLALRMKQHCQNAQAVAEFLESHPQVERVHYPGLVSHPDHEVAKRQMSGFGGMVSVEVKGGAAKARKVAESTKMFLLAESLGGVESLMGYPPLMSHAGMTEDERLERGIPPTLLRLSVGIEDVQDLIEDLDQALTAN